MGQVNVSINGKNYRMACDDGQEAHLTGLAERLNAAIDALRQRFGEIGDQRLIVMAALTFADQAAEAGRRIASLEADLTQAEEARAASAELSAAAAQRVASVLCGAAERIESLAGKVGANRINGD